MCVTAQRKNANIYSSLGILHSGEADFKKLIYSLAPNTFIDSKKSSSANIEMGVFL